MSHEKLIVIGRKTHRLEKTELSSIWRVSYESVRDGLGSSAPKADPMGTAETVDKGKD